ncbi:serine/threonine protein kinase [archaeon]|jgi:serine/threonine protein kinase|nr:serine/threonine protein kinase [archaeon]MBT4417528.1 serine/threonine protein kinase [archaeon]
MILYTGGCDLDDYITDAENVLDVQGWSKENFHGASASFYSNETFFGFKFLMKLFNDTFAGSVRRQHLINREIKILNVCTENDLSGFPRLYGSGEIEGDDYLIMNFFQGREVVKLISDPNFDRSSFIPYLPQLADDIGGLHGVDYIHRDIKPANLLLLEDGFRIVDLGIAVSVDGDFRIGRTAGTPGYMSPEHCDGLKLSPTSDVYALGMTLYQMLFGKHPFFKATSTKEVMNWQINKMPRPLSEFVFVPEGLSRVVMKALAKYPDDRFRNGHEMADALARVC